MDKRLFRILLLLCGLSLVGAALLYPRLPTYVPTHWNVYGEVDGFGPKLLTLFLMGVPLLVLAGLRLLPQVDPRGHNLLKHPRAYNIISAILVLILQGLMWILYLPGLGIPLPVERLISPAIGALFIVMGNFMPQVRSNYFMGIRTPWALASDEVWRKTHRAGGFVFCVGGALFILCAFLPAGLWQLLPVVFLLASVVLLYVYSYRVYRGL